MRLSYLRLSCLGALGVLLALGCTVSTPGAGESDSNEPVTGEPTTNTTGSGNTSNTTAPDQSNTEADDSPADDSPTDDSERDTSDSEDVDDASDETTSDPSDETSDDGAGEIDGGFPFDPPWDRDEDESDPQTDTDNTDTDVTDTTDPDTDATDTEGTDTDATDTGSDDTSGTEPGEDCVPDYECEPEAPNTGDFYADCVTRVNQFRACVCLPALERATEAEGCLDQQAEYDSTHSPHAGFIDGICEPQASAQNECPGWGGPQDVVDGCIQSMFNEGPPPTDECEDECYQEHGHFINMTGTRYTRVACGMYQDGDETWSVQNFF